MKREGAPDSGSASRRRAMAPDIFDRAKVGLAELLRVLVLRCHEAVEYLLRSQVSFLGPVALGILAADIGQGNVQALSPQDRACSVDVGSLLVGETPPFPAPKIGWQLPVWIRLHPVSKLPSLPFSY